MLKEDSKVKLPGKRIRLGKKADLLLKLINNAKLGIVVIDQSHRVIEANQRFAEMLGYSMDEVVNLYTWNYEAAAPGIKAGEGRADLSNVDFSIETKHIRKDGVTIDVEVTGAGINLGRGVDNNAMLCFCQDITERKKTERLLIRNEKRYRSFVENAADIVYTVNENAEVLYISPNSKRIIGYTPEELEGKKLLNLFEQGDRDLYLADIRQAFAGVYHSSYEYRIAHKYKSLEWYSIRLSTMRENDEKLLICNARNITEKKEYEKKLEFLSMHDQLTGIYNRAYFSEEITRRDAQGIYPISIISLDLDGLKKVNDSQGHPAGDEMLKNCTRLIRTSLRKADTFARTGGDEFYIVLPETPMEYAESMAKRIISRIEDFNACSDLPPLSISIGIAAKDCPDVSLELIIKEADKRMYMNKRKKSVNIGTI